MSLKSSGRWQQTARGVRPVSSPALPARNDRPQSLETAEMT